ncbi:hypothetical protein [Sphingomonas albertensis]|uniref:Uncharacterized protein n=1 Tax=Sphingomonas albertensis TaxID=2762591 RepID=A0ABR7AJJ2_9SPHN|nr:hypothetical protein [Sphingomonas albertensis]MBC3940624.1 hypothetical protein [Sphingomonas albertensis]
MIASIQSAYQSHTSIASSKVAYDDPLDEDLKSDGALRVTRRGLTRLAVIAAETGARFQREGGGEDPMNWLLSPRRLFAGGTAIEAVLRREDFLRALLLHGLSLGLDAEPEFIDDLVSDDDDNSDDDCVEDDVQLSVATIDGRDGCSPRTPARRADRQSGKREVVSTPRPPRVAGSHADTGDAVDEGRPTRLEPRLFTATLVHDDGRMILQAFHASICSGALEAVQRLSGRYGAVAASEAELTEGFDPTSSFAEALVSPAISDMLRLVESEPCGELAMGLDLNLEQRFAA